MLVKQVIHLLEQIGVFILMYFDVLYVQDFNVFDLLKKILKNLVVSKYSQTSILCHPLGPRESGIVARVV